jgi:hypothetical protein
VGAQDLALRYVAYAIMLAVVAAGLFGLLEAEDDAGVTGVTGDAEMEYPAITRQRLKPTLVVDVVTARRARGSRPWCSHPTTSRGCSSAP